ncbi:hypothetical protein CC80DRAFT_522750 [Byssothecium circinans]|uniref:Sld7 C-terminal domain-containing protein n=1 Tax=Byssothecium circinans TaxID=147558 RepID=A0A6A5UJJ4_9PLEO|nr:hypothetical protein CC80DRAFT_522750 [Byssothecium circinans]
MADIWNGGICLPDGTTINDVGFASHNVPSAPIISTASLRFLSTVDTSRVPLYLAAGPSLDVWTSSEATEEWFASILSSAPTTTAGDVTAQKWWAHARSQAPIGFLAKVKEGHIKATGLRITEILFYGTVTAHSNGAVVLPTPPSSSPEAPQVEGEQEERPELKIHALPLSSDLLYQDALRGIPPLSPALNGSDPHTDIPPQFLPSQHRPDTTPVSPKRKRDLVEEAAAARKKARLAAAAIAKEQESQRAYCHRKSVSTDAKALLFPESRPSSAGSRPPSRPLSRSPSISSDARPLSRKGASESQTKRSTLSQVATVPVQPEEPTTESRNKEALSRVVMTAMRMHGFQQRKKSKSRRGSVAPGIDQEQLSEETAAEEAAKDEEYKLVYHQTYKGAALALRKHITTKPLHSQPDRLRDVVEKLLAIFCTDPLTQPLQNEVSMDPLATPGKGDGLGVPRSTHSRTSPFDMPSTQRIKVVKTAEESVVNTGSPSPIGAGTEQLAAARVLPGTAVLIAMAVPELVGGDDGLAAGSHVVVRRMMNRLEDAIDILWFLDVVWW